MSIILHRGKRIDGEGWAYGYYVHLKSYKGKEKHRVYTGDAETDCDDFYPEWYDVDPTTVGRFTGVCDKNGMEIFEGDNVKGKGTRTFVVAYAENIAGFVCLPTDGGNSYPCMNYGTMQSYEVVGNIHDQSGERDG